MSFSAPPSAVISQPVTGLKPNPRNARTHSKHQIRQIADSIEAFGFLNPVLVDEAGMVLAGHGRLAAAKLLKLASVPTLLASGLSEAQKRAYVLADNKLAEKAGWDRALLAIELGELAELLPPLNWDLTLTGFETAEIDLILADHAEDRPTPEDVLPAASGPAVTRRGDLWCLGAHRLLCGDARSADDLDRLMAGAKADMVFTDPPYNVPIAGHVQGRGRVQHREFAFASGEMSEEAFTRFLQDSLGNAVRVSGAGAVHDVCMDWRHIATLIRVGEDLYGALLNLCVWAKTNAGQGSFYRSQHELVAVFRVGDEAHQNNVQLGRFGRNRSNVWSYPGSSGFGGEAERAGHPTPKPVALVADAIRDCTGRGARVLDPFLGSGTTLLAAEKVGRCGYGLEYEPTYVDVAIRRWQTYTGRDAVLEADGRTYAEISAERNEAELDLRSRAGDRS
ncbi:site-specific DNA-methyltransferase [Methylobacterium oxalidis]|uniref:site-specific DNA-methyltransferase n=1 Tax=Methylobacterium oxalidis TaxID=944322 RepID=UPI0033160D7A